MEHEALSGSKTVKNGAVLGVEHELRGRFPEIVLEILIAHLGSHLSDVSVFNLLFEQEAKHTAAGGVSHKEEHDEEELVGPRVDFPSRARVELSSDV